MRGGKERLHPKDVPFIPATDLAPNPQDGVSPSTSHGRSFPTSLQLRDNRQYPPTSLELDAAGIPSQRKSGNLTSTDADGDTFRAVTSATNADNLSSEQSPDDPADGQEHSKKKKRKRRKKETEVTEMSLTSHQRELAQDESINCAPFRFKPEQLTHILDPKDIGTLTALGGTDGIIRGLGTHPEHGLTTKPLHTGWKLPQGADQEASYSLPSGEDNAPYSGTMDDRKRVYGEKVLPVRTSKTLLQLMAAALKDKVLVCGGALPQ